MKLGIGSYTYMWSIGFPGAEPPAPMTAAGLLEEACRLGVDVAQYGPNLSLLELAESELTMLVRRARQADVEIEIGMRGFEASDVSRNLELCRRTGARLLRTVSGYQMSDPAPDEETLRGWLEGLLPALAAAQVRLAVENSNIPAAVMARVLDTLDSPWLGITLDTVNSLAIPEGTEEVARVLAPHIRCLHVKDFAVERIWHSMGFTVEGRAAGQGQLDIPWLLKLAGRSSGNAILELWVPRRETIEATIALERRWAAESVAYLRQFIPPRARRQGESHVG